MRRFAWVVFWGKNKDKADEYFRKAIASGAWDEVGYDLSRKELGLIQVENLEGN